ncbi:hypothetical protein OQZ33_09230 [Pedobacter sp. MC2016-05]|uniref:hypothetical protein n=1 Tax=Pedobacter sp. MC2016-05 TaxID=2994474 RepID=UPI00224850BE|nr:hypothetical protein [Pedobacter sp. MC2016-05]MCX2474508.1 hypothetical protein [Pedobacter sp. MC2016-05]
MRRAVLLCYFVFCAVLSNAQSVFLKEKPANEKAAVSINDHAPSVMFFGVNDGSDSWKNHKQKEKEVNAYFGSVYSNFPILDIGKEHVVEYSNSNGKFVFYRPNTKRQFGMIVSNGKDKPILVLNPDQYLKTIKTYLNIGSADDLVPKTLDERDQKDAVKEMQGVLKIKFVTDQSYAQRLIKNASSVHYSNTYEDGSPKMTCTNRVFEMFGDSLMTTKSPYGANYVYDKNNIMQSMDNTMNGKPSGYSKYLRDQNGLIKKIVSGDEKSTDSTVFIYEKDKYHTISFSGSRPYSLETFFLNDQMQCVRRLSKRSDQSIIWDITYIYDKFGRIIREGKVDSEMIYSYKNDSDAIFSGFKSYSLNPRRLDLQNEIIREKNKQTFIGRNGTGGLNFISVTYTAKDRSTKTYSYDKDNKLTSVSVIRCL